MSWSDIVGNVGRNQYRDRIQLLNSRGITTTEIEHTVEGALRNLKKGAKSFVIFGEPQSGKTEMMIALNAKLLDEGYDVIINLLTDSVDLLQQSLSRFGSANLSPSPKEFKELPAEAKKLVGKQWIIFSKKNAKDLEKLSESLRFMKSLIVIDDEADYASPNAKVSRDSLILLVDRLTASHRLRLSLHSSHESMDSGQLAILAILALALAIKPHAA